MKYNPSDPNHFLNALAISKEERQRLGELGPKGALDLLARRRAAKDAFDAYVGSDRADAIAAELERALTPEERKVLATPLPQPRRLGARADKKL